MASRRAKVHGVIHTASAGAAAVGAGMARIPGSDDDACRWQTAASFGWGLGVPIRSGTE